MPLVYYFFFLFIFHSLYSPFSCSNFVYVYILYYSVYKVYIDRVCTIPFHSIRVLLLKLLFVRVHDVCTYVVRVLCCKQLIWWKKKNNIEPYFIISTIHNIIERYSTCTLYVSHLYISIIISICFFFSSFFVFYAFRSHILFHQHFFRMLNVM